MDPFEAPNMYQLMHLLNTQVAIRIVTAKLDYMLVILRSLTIYKKMDPALVTIIEQFYAM